MGWMGPGEHEGWVVPLFADGAEGAGSSGTKGVLVRRGDSDETDEWRPDAAVVGYIAGCECGWRGRPWTRTTPDKADPAARLLASSGPDFYELDEHAEHLVIEEWRAHVLPANAVQWVEDAAQQVAEASQALDDAVQVARDCGASWADIGRAAGMTRQSANERWSARV